MLDVLERDVFWLGMYGDYVKYIIIGDIVLGAYKFKE